MKLSLVFCLLFTLAATLAPRLEAKTDPSQLYLDVYLAIESADHAEAAGDWGNADTQLRAALQVLHQIKTAMPGWHSNLVEFRIKYCEEHLAKIQPNLPAIPVAPAVVPAPIAPSEPDQIRQLQAELQKTRDEVKKLEEIRNELNAKLEAKLKEPAPTDRAAAQQTLEQIHALETVNEAVQAKLELAQQKAGRAEQLEAELRRAQQKIAGLESEQAGLNAKLTETLSRLPTTQASPQVEQLMKQNADLTAQLATAQAAVTKMRDEVTAGKPTPAVEAGESVKLRGEIGQLQSELDQAKATLAQRTEELTATRTELVKVREVNTQLTNWKVEFIAKLAESDRQLHAARTSTEKDNEIIQQLRKENALLHELADKQAGAPAPQAKSKGFLWFKPKPASPPVAALPSESAVSHSEAGKLTAAVKAPEVPESVRAPATEMPLPAAGPAAKESPLVRSLLADARTAIAQRDLNTAASKFQSVLDQDPRNVTALSNLGVVYYKQNRLDEAEELLRKTTAIAPNDGQTRSVLGVVCFRKGRPEDAYNELVRAVALSPRNPEAHNYLGIIMSEKGWTTAAEQEVRKAIELNPEYADAHFNLAVIYAHEKTPRLELARHHYQQARELGAEADANLETLLGLKATPTAP